MKIRRSIDKRDEKGKSIYRRTEKISMQGKRNRKKDMRKEETEAMKRKDKIK